MEAGREGCARPGPCRTVRLRSGEDAASVGVHSALESTQRGRGYRGKIFLVFPSCGNMTTVSDSAFIPVLVDHVTHLLAQHPLVDKVTATFAIHASLMD